MQLRRKIELSGGIARESYPGAAQDVLGIPRKRAGVGPLRAGLLQLGLSGDIERTDLSHDELDAVTAAYVGRLWLECRAEEIGLPREGLMILPLGSAKASSARSRRLLVTTPRRDPV
jgi:hypothetical protein